jgi:hypothetical protein
MVDHASVRVDLDEEGPCLQDRVAVKRIIYVQLGLLSISRSSSLEEFAGPRAERNLTARWPAVIRPAYCYNPRNTSAQK